MKYKAFFILLTIVLVSALITSSIAFNKSAEVKASYKTAINAQQPVAQSPLTDPPNTINGKEHPELVPDHTAYSLLFVLLANRQTNADKQRIHAYLSQAGFDEASADILIVVANEYQQRVAVLDNQARELKRAHWPNPSASEIAQLASLRQQKELISIDSIRELSIRLSSSSMDVLRQHINGRVKSKIKIVPDSQ